MYMRSHILRALYAWRHGMSSGVSPPDGSSYAAKSSSWPNHEPFFRIATSSPPCVIDDARRSRAASISSGVGDAGAGGDAPPSPSNLPVPRISGDGVRESATSVTSYCEISPFWTRMSWWHLCGSVGSPRTSPAAQRSGRSMSTSTSMNS